MKILMMVSLAGTMLTATPMTSPMSQSDASAPAWVGDIAHTDHDPLHSPRFQSLMTWNTNGHEEFLPSQTAPVPEPDTLLLMAGGLLLAAGVARKQVRREQCATRPK